MEELDFDKIVSSLADAAYEESVDRLFESLLEDQAGPEVLFSAGRVIGRLDIMKQLTRMLEHERKILAKATKPGSGKKNSEDEDFEDED